MLSKSLYNVACLYSSALTHCYLEVCTWPYNLGLKVAVNVSGGEQTFPQIMADFSLFVHKTPSKLYIFRKLRF